MTAYYNEIEPFAAEWLRNLIAEKLIPAGDVDTRSIVDVEPDDLVEYSQCHFFAGVSGWALAARLAGWPDDREIWTGSPPCQPFSVAGKQRGRDDDRHLWPHYFRLISARRPAVAMGEQVAAAVGKAWLDGVLADLEGIGYTGRAVVVPACAVDAPHRRDRLWFVAERGNDNDSTGWAQQDRPVAEAGSGGNVAQPGGAGHDGAHRDAAEPRGDGQDDRLPVGSGGELCGASTVADANGIGGQVDPNAGCREAGSRAREIAGLGGARHGDVADALRSGPHAGAYSRIRGGEEIAGSRYVGTAGLRGTGSAWHGAGWIIGHDGKARRVEPSIRLLADGLSARVGRLRAYGNAIVPALAAEVIGAYLDCMPVTA